MNHCVVNVEQIITKVPEQIGFSNVKEKQKEAILAFLPRKDTFMSLPTGYGKSMILLCCQEFLTELKVTQYNVCK